MDIIIGVVLILVAALMLKNAKTGSKSMKDHPGMDGFTFVGWEKARIRMQNELRHRFNDNRIEVYRLSNMTGAGPDWCITNVGIYMFKKRENYIQSEYMMPYEDIIRINIIPKSSEGWYGIAQIVAKGNGEPEITDLKMHNEQIGQLCADLAVVTRNYIGKENR